MKKQLYDRKPLHGKRKSLLLGSDKSNLFVFYEKFDTIWACLDLK
ncbi:hypothetical protein S1OALGB6SA_736 [Olavius algarvensis spirochete endosymbiont]|nr:hypothetical protein S1OALGB6SA_736 [Olavius algarvensis spirochete endosymbiont]